MEVIDNYRDYPWDPSAQQESSFSSVDTQNESEGHPFVQYTISKHVNQKMYLIRAQAWHIVADVAVIGSNEGLSDRSAGFQEVLRVGGREVQQACIQEKRVRTGNAAILPSGNLPCDHLIAAIGPKFVEKYASAAENALSAAVRNAMQLAFENDFFTVAMSCIYLERKNFPRVDACHIMCRTIRKFLDKYGNKFKAIILAPETQEDFDIFQLVMPYYFPRDEEDLVHQIEDIGDDHTNALGELVHEERNIRITRFPSAHPGETRRSSFGSDGSMEEKEGRIRTQSEEARDYALNDTLTSYESNIEGSFTIEDDSTDFHSNQAWNHDYQQSEGKRRSGSVDRPHVSQHQEYIHTRKRMNSDVTHNFMDYTENPDEERRHRSYQQPVRTLPLADTTPEEFEERILADISEASVANFSSILGLEYFYAVGTDFKGRTVVVIHGKNLPVRKTNLRLLRQFIMWRMEEIALKPYVLVYFDALVDPDRNIPPETWLSDMFEIFRRRYKQNLDQVIVVHPSLYIKTAIFAYLPMTTGVFWDETTYVDSLRELQHHTTIDLNQLPEYVTSYDQMGF